MIIVTISLLYIQIMSQSNNKAHCCCLHPQSNVANQHQLANLHSLSVTREHLVIDTRFFIQMVSLLYIMYYYRYCLTTAAEIRNGLWYSSSGISPWYNTTATNLAAELSPDSVSITFYNVVCIHCVYASCQTSLSPERGSSFPRGMRSGAHIWLISGCMQSFFAWDEGVQFTNTSFCWASLFNDLLQKCKSFHCNTTS